MATKAPATTQVKFTNGHDRMAIVAKFPNGEQFKFSVSRSGERMATAQAPGVHLSDEQVISLDDMTQFRAGETNLVRFERIKATCERVTSLSALAAL